MSSREVLSSRERTVMDSVLVGKIKFQWLSYFLEMFQCVNFLLQVAKCGNLLIVP